MSLHERIYDLEDTQAMDLSGLQESTIKLEAHSNEVEMPKWLGKLSMLSDNIDTKFEQLASSWNKKAENHASMRVVSGIASVVALGFGRNH